MTKEDVIKEFTSLKGVGQAKAEALYNAGYTSMEKLGKASVDEITNVKGITENAAKVIFDQLNDTSKEPTEPVAQKEEKKIVTPEESKPVAQKEEKKIVTPEESKPVESKKRGNPKKKPQLDTSTKGSLEIRKEIKGRTPKFLREEWFRYKRIPHNWRRPDGITSKMRINLKYRPSRVRVGFRGPKDVRGLHASGFEEVMIYNVNDLDGIDPKTQAARIGGTVGMKKRLAIASKAKEMKIRILNMREV